MATQNAVNPRNDNTMNEKQTLEKTHWKNQVIEEYKKRPVKERSGTILNRLQSDEWENWHKLYEMGQYRRDNPYDEQKWRKEKVEKAEKAKQEGKTPDKDNESYREFYVRTLKGYENYLKRMEAEKLDCMPTFPKDADVAAEKKKIKDNTPLTADTRADEFVGKSAAEIEKIFDQTFEIRREKLMEKQKKRKL